MSILSENDACALSIVSAGYGLITPDSPLKPYSATFSAGPDSIAPVGLDAASAGREWWRALTEAAAVDDGPRSLTELVASKPAAVVLVALSAPYVRALRDDLVSAARALGEGRLILVSVGTRHVDGLDGGLVPVSVELQRVLGGSRLSLNVRIARYLLGESSTHQWKTALITDLLGSLVEHADPCARQRRARMTDAEVMAFIQQARRAEPDVPKSHLLRRLRDGGRACEQQRFGELFARSAPR